MADRIVQPKVLASTNPDTYNNLIIQQAQNATNATYATYASIDTSKGTIEERLTKLGFRTGVFGVTPSSTGSIMFTVTKNVINRQGNYCIASLEFTYGGSGSGVLNVPTITVPTEFLPLADTTFNVLIGDTTFDIENWTITIKTTGEVLYNKNPGTSTFFNGLSLLNVGYEAAPL